MNDVSHWLTNLHFNSTPPNFRSQENLGVLTSVVTKFEGVWWESTVFSSQRSLCPDVNLFIVFMQQVQPTKYFLFCVCDSAQRGIF